MPISSGALEWPNSYFRKPEEEETVAQIGGSTRNPEASTNGHPWHIQLSDREDYERWKRGYDAQRAREDVDIVLRRRRRRLCVVLTSGLTLVLLLVLLGLVTVYVNFLEEDDLGPAVQFDSDCHGRWRDHYLGYNATYPNGTVYYICCYLPNINVSYRDYTLNKGPTWPQGYLVPPAACLSPGGKCEDLEQKGQFPPDTPPCSESVHHVIDIGLFIGCLILLVYEVC